MNFNIRNNIMRSGIHDITDGEQHRMLVLRVRTYYAGIIDEPYEVLSFTMNTDGVQIFEFEWREDHLGTVNVPKSTIHHSSKLPHHNYTVTLC